MKDRFVKMGRLALREEGNMWNAYYALPTSMKGAVFLGSIAMALVKHDGQMARRKEERKQAFIELMRESVADILEESTGVRPSWPDGIQPAPEIERGGHG